MKNIFDSPPSPYLNTLDATESPLLSALRSISQTHTWKELVEVLSIYSLPGVDSICLLYFRSAHINELDIMAQWDRRHDVAEQYEGVVTAVEQLNALLIYDSATTYELPAGWHTLMHQQGVRNAIALPLILNQRMLGYLSLACTQQHIFTPAELQELQVIAHLCATMVLVFERNNEFAAQIRRIQGLYRISEALVDSMDEQQLFDTISVLLVDDVGYLNSWIALVDTEAGLLREKSGAGAGTEHIVLDEVYSLEDLSITGVASVRQKQPIIVADAIGQAIAEGWGDFALQANLKTLLYVPLRTATDVLGVLSVGTSATSVTEEELELLIAFGNQIAIALNRIRLQQEQQRYVIEIEQSYAKQAQLLEAVRVLSTPIVPVYDGILILPLIGTLDATRSNLVMQAMLTAIQRHRARVIIVDVTGIAHIDMEVMDYLMQAIRAAALLGAQTVLVGVHPEVAQTLVQLGGDFRNITTRRDLQSGMAYALRISGRQVMAFAS